MYDNISQLLTVIALISASSERVVELIKSFLDRSPSSKDRTRLYIILSYTSAGTIYAVSGFNVFPGMHQFIQTVLIALVCSAGSGFWHDVVKIVASLKISKPA